MAKLVCLCVGGWAFSLVRTPRFLFKPSPSSSRCRCQVAAMFARRRLTNYSASDVMRAHRSRRIPRHQGKVPIDLTEKHFLLAWFPPPEGQGPHTGGPQDTPEGRDPPTRGPQDKPEMLRDE
ncbi:hypothetical protein EYF80_041937 [Liparis tanakae]|uniref:Uncharacterized protein n=1 Tax=Liparis tanakae TaxID=230148 RepID=A0A4Z2G2U0_9TELE|nr:hypothetical protein EYF80_041937 [Liparis tanakae]